MVSQLKTNFSLMIAGRGTFSEVSGGFLFTWADGWCPCEGKRIQHTWEHHICAESPLRVAAVHVRIVHRYVGHESLLKRVVNSKRQRAIVKLAALITGVM